ncbi:SDR family oxidoreductase [Streptomyces shenzhenensis]|uniref:SDR family oxidoreductase n=1 Tax=Streptomyces shenzhenensis TaxID=943815 RepID=UPI0036C6CA2C
MTPGAIATGMPAIAIEEAPDPQRLVHDFGSLHPLVRLGEFAEIAGVVSSLPSDASSFVSGAVIPVGWARPLVSFRRIKTYRRCSSVPDTRS